jgi:hypothetical protein
LHGAAPHDTRVLAAVGSGAHVWVREEHEKKNSRVGESSLVADGAVLRFVVVHRNFEHVVAADADPVDFGRRLFAGLQWQIVAASDSLVRDSGSLHFGHSRILARGTEPGERFKSSGSSGGMGFVQDVENARNDFPDLNGPIERDACVLTGRSVFVQTLRQWNLFGA